MTGYITKWSVVFAWAVAMLIVWALFVPKSVSIGTFTLPTMTGIATLFAGAALWRAQRPAQSIRQVRASTDADDERRSAVASRLGGH